MKTNDIKKGMVVKLRNGWFGIMADNMRGNTRMVDVDGFEREIGSVYSHDIKFVWPHYTLELGKHISKGSEHGCGDYVEYTKAQLLLKEQFNNYFL